MWYTENARGAKRTWTQINVVSSECGLKWTIFKRTLFKGIVVTRHGSIIGMVDMNNIGQ